MSPRCALDVAKPTISEEDRERGARVQALRKALGLTQVGLASRDPRGDLPQGQISKVETGENKLSGIELATQLARAFGVTLDTLNAYVSGSVSLAAMVAHVRDHAPLETTEPQSLAFIPPGMTLDDAPPELRKLIAADELPEDLRHTIPTLMQLPWPTVRKLQTREDWLREAAACADGPRLLAASQGLGSLSKEKVGELQQSLGVKAVPQVEGASEAEHAAKKRPRPKR